MIRIILAALLFTLPASAKEVLPGPFQAQVLSVYDGDTFTARIRIWLGQDVETRVRIRGIDTPEIEGKCAKERELAIRARDRAREILGASVTLKNVSFDKYGGRIDADVDMNALVDEGLARVWTGRRLSWCENEK